MSLFPRFPKKYWWQNYNQELRKTEPLHGAGTPTVTETYAKSVGQIYVDTVAKKAYVAVSVTSVFADWVILN